MVELDRSFVAGLGITKTRIRTALSGLSSCPAAMRQCTRRPLKMDFSADNFIIFHHLAPDALYAWCLFHGLDLSSYLMKTNLRSRLLLNMPDNEGTAIHQRTTHCPAQSFQAREAFIVVGTSRSAIDDC